MCEISIIIPVYNAEQYLKECIDSALNQTIREKEIICIDDGSIDDSLVILQEYERKYKEIHVFRQENRGSGEARNAGLRVARGEFVCFLDSDDYYWDNHALEQMVYMCRKNGMKVCGSLRKTHNMKNGEIGNDELHRSVCVGHPIGVQIKFSEYQNDYYYQNYIFELRMIRENNIIFPDYRRYQDPPFFLKAMLCAESFWIMPVNLYCYRIGHQNKQLYEKFLHHILMGIRDNMVLAKENQLYDLQKLLVERVNVHFHSYIVNNFSRETFNILCEIENEILDKTMLIKYLDEIWNYYDLSLSYYIIRVLYTARCNGLSMESYLQTRGIKRIAIYGLGTFGTIVYNDLNNSSIEIIYGIDICGKKIDDLKTVCNVESITDCDAIIVTPIKNNVGITEELRTRTKIQLLALLEIIWDMKKSNF